MAKTNITVPDIGGATDVEVIEVLVKAGDSIRLDSPLLTLESDKATMDLPSTVTGTIQEMKVKVGDKVSKGSVIAIVETETTAGVNKATAVPATTKSIPVPPVPEAEVMTKAPPSAATVAATTITTATEDKMHAGPAVRKLAREFGIDLSQVSPSGPKERIMVEDLQAYVKAKLNGPAVDKVSGALPPAPVVDFTQFGAIETRSLTRIKKLTGKYLHRNWLLVPHVTQFGEADITQLEEFRLNQKATLEKQGIKLTPLVFIMKAVTAALKKFPTFNASLDSNGEQLILKKYFHIGVAVDTSEGLVVPVVRDVDQKGLVELAKELGTLSEKARNKQLLPTDMQGGCFSISSLGGIGGTAFTPIVNLPEVAILGVSKSSYQPVYQEGQFVPRLMLPLSLSYDHRVIDGAEGARFITYLSQLLSDIRNVLL